MCTATAGDKAVLCLHKMGLGLDPSFVLKCICNFISMQFSGFLLPVLCNVEVNAGIRQSYTVGDKM